MQTKRNSTCREWCEIVNAKDTQYYTACSGTQQDGREDEFRLLVEENLNLALDAFNFSIFGLSLLVYVVRNVYIKTFSYAYHEVPMRWRYRDTHNTIVCYYYYCFLVQSVSGKSNFCLYESPLERFPSFNCCAQLVRAFHFGANGEQQANRLFVCYCASHSVDRTVCYNCEFKCKINDLKSYFVFRMNAKGNQNALAQNRGDWRRNYKFRSEIILYLFNFILFDFDCWPLVCANGFGWISIYRSFRQRGTGGGVGRDHKIYEIFVPIITCISIVTKLQ